MIHTSYIKNYNINHFFKVDYISYLIPTVILFKLIILFISSNFALGFDTTAKSAIVYDETTKSILFEKYADKPLPPASMSKLMTLLLTFEALEEKRINLSTKFRVSEKAATRADLENQHVFSVLKNATKPEIKKAVELMFDVKVKSVKVINMQGKLTRIGRTFGKRKDWKKAYVRLEEGFDINYGEEEAGK